MPGSQQSIGDACFVLNTIVAESFRQFADRLEGAEDMDAAVDALIKEVFTKHQRIVFNGDNYTEEWEKEAEARGLHNMRNTVDAAPALIDEKNIELFKRHGIFSEIESRARYEIKLEEYAKLRNIEALTMIDMTRKNILPAVSAYSNDLANTALAKKELGVNPRAEIQLLTEISDLQAELLDKITALESAVESTENFTLTEQAPIFLKDVLPKMEELRVVADKLETLTSEEYWPFPTYTDLLYRI